MKIREYLSLPSRERGLKSGCPVEKVLAPDVAPFAGAWIEIYFPRVPRPERFRRSLRGSVD